MRTLVALVAAAARLHVGVWSAAVVVAVQAFNLLDRGMPWRGEWNWAVDWAGSGLIILGPLLAGLAAVDGGRLRNDSRLPQTRLLSRPFRAVIGLWATSFVPAAAAYMVSVGVFLYLADSATAVPRTPALLLSLVQVAAMMAYLLFGSVVGRLLGAVVGAPTAVIAAIAIYWNLGRSGGGFAPFDVGSATSSLLGLQFSLEYLLAQASYMALFSAICLTVHAAMESRFRALTATGAVITVVALGALPINVPRLGEHPVAATTCTSGEITVCVYPEHERFLDGLARDVLAVRQAATRVGIADLLPRSYVERVPGEGTRPADDGRGRLEIMPDYFTSGKVPLANVVYAMVLPWHCPQLFGEEPPPPALIDSVARISDALNAIAESPGSSPKVTREEARETILTINQCEPRS
ncbi:hypothetical protein [Micromonospora tulbaghiae]